MQLRQKSEIEPREGRQHHGGVGGEMQVCGSTALLTGSLLYLQKRKWTEIMQRPENEK